MERWDPPSWALPLIVIAIVVPPFLGFAIGGEVVGAALGFVVVAALIAFAVRLRPRGPIELARDDPRGTAARFRAGADRPRGDRERDRDARRGERPA